MTTGQPIKVPSDRNKYNNEFMESLRLQIKLNDQNLQANRLYITTGQMPASTQMADTRSTSEKLADIEGLKRSIVADLSPVAEPAFAYAIIEGVINSPLNIDNSLFRYLAQNAPQIAQQLSKKYKFGIAGDANDVQLLVEFLNDAYSKTKGTFQTIKGYMNSTTNLRANGTNIQDQIIQEFKFFLQRLTGLELETTRKYGPVSPILDSIHDVQRIISEIIFSLPNQQQMKQILSDITSESYIHPFNDPAIAQNIPGQQYDDRIVKLVIEMIEKLPNFDQVRTLINTLESGINRGSQSIITSSLRSIEGLFTDWIIRPGAQRTPFQDALEQFRSTFLREANEEIEEANRVNRISTIRQIEFQNNQNQRDAKAQRVYVINPGTDPVKVTNGPFQQGPGDDNSSYGSIGGYQSNSQPPSSLYSGSQAPGSDSGYASGYASGSSPPQSWYGGGGGGGDGGGGGGGGYAGSQAPQSEHSFASGWNDPSGQALRSDIPIPSDISENLSLNYANIYPSVNSSERSFVRDAPSEEEYKEEEIPEGASFMPEPNPPPKFSEVSSGKRAPPPIPVPVPVPVTKPSREQLLYDEIKTQYKKIYKEPYKLELELANINPYLFAQDPEFQKSSTSSNPLLQPSVKESKAPEVSRVSRTATPVKEYANLHVHHIEHYEKLKREGRITKEDQDELDNRLTKIISNGRSHNVNIADLDKELRDMENSYFGQKGGKGLKKGRGISSDYRDFGINKINHKKLDDGILTLRRKSNTNIPDMPSKRISRKLQKIIKHISGGGVPDYNDLNSLEDGEKDYLHKLISKSNLNDRLSVPAPSKDQEEKDFHQFEVMKGEIMSGNDSRELVKKFKVLILKLSKQNVLPRNEVQELLEDLLSLGY